jgi:hypothetical protein
MRSWIRDHPVLAGGVTLVLVAGAVTATVLGRGLLLWMIWAGLAVAAVVVLIGLPEEPP